MRQNTGQMQSHHNLQMNTNHMLQQVVSGQLLGSARNTAAGQGGKSFLNKLGLQPDTAMKSFNASMQKVCFYYF